MVEFLLQVKLLGDIGTMTERWLRCRSGTCDGVNPDNAVNVDMDSNSTYLESETDIAVSANPTVEVGVQNSEFSTTLFGYSIESWTLASG